jgi:hypothetical protein
MPAPVVVRVRPVRDVTCRKRAKRPDCLKASGPNSTKRAGIISRRGWKRKFDDPIPLPKGRQLVTLGEPARYIQKLPKAEQQIEEWQAAVEAAAPGRRTQRHARKRLPSYPKRPKRSRRRADIIHNGDPMRRIIAP